MLVGRWVWMFVAGFMLVGCAQAQETTSAQRQVRVVGESTVTTAPDQATVRFGIVSQAETAEEARAKNATASKNAMNTVRELDVPDEKMRMDALRLRPQREYNPQTETREKTGYKASRQVVVTLSDLAQLPRLVARVVQEGANRLEDIEYGLSDRTEARNEALKEAARSARDKADLLAEALNATVGSVQQIEEQSFGVDQPSPRVEQYAKSAQDRAAPEPEAYAAGEIEVSATVEVTFGLR